MFAAIIAALLALITALSSPASASWDADTASDVPVVAACQEEDGSTPGQSFPCYWDAATQGNRRGTSFYLDAPAS